MSWDGEVKTHEPEEKRLTIDQERRLMKHTEELRTTETMEQVVLIKKAIAEGQIDDAKAYWSDFSQTEQMNLWIAPSKGGVFTTAERKALHYKQEK